MNDINVVIKAYHKKHGSEITLRSDITELTLHNEEPQQPFCMVTAVNNCLAEDICNLLRITIFDNYYK